MSASSESTGLLNLEKELICFICTEVLYQPLTLIDCLHTFCGSCLKEWFSHQHKKALQSRSPPANPYTCPTCRATVKDARHNATVTTLLDMFLTANPARVRTAEEKAEMAQIYKPGNNILPQIEQPRRRERRHRREEEDAEAQERRMVEEARERSLRDVQRDRDEPSGRLATPSSQHEQSRSREREERRERRREQDRVERRRRAEAAEAALVPPRPVNQLSSTEDSGSLSPPSSSPRHPDAVEARQRERTVAHQTSLRSLVSASESSTGTGDSFSEARIMQEILAEGLLDGIDVERLTESEQDALSERIAEAYRQRHPRRNEQSTAESPDPNTTAARALHVPERPSPSGRSSERSQRQRSRSTHRSTNTSSRPGVQGQEHRSQQYVIGGLSPPVARHGHRRRASDENRRQTSPAQANQSPAARSATDLSNRTPESQTPPADGVRRLSDARRTHTEPAQSSVKASEAWRQGGVETRLQDQGTQRAKSPSRIAQPSKSPRMRAAEAPSAAVVPPTELTKKEPEEPSEPPPAIPVLFDQQPTTTDQPPSFLKEPSITCARCSRPDIQYEVHRHCEPCKMDLCLRCYRAGRGCNHWFGFGHAALAKFNASGTDRGSKLLEQPHIFSSRQYQRPPEGSVQQTEGGIKRTTSNPSERLQEGHFCDRCGLFANACFWSCDYCFDGEWGFCNSCVDTHHCCMHPLLPIAHKLFAPQSTTSQPPADYDLSNAHTPDHSRPSTSHSSSHPSDAQSDYVPLSVSASCDKCGQDIAPSQPRYHCPSHPSSNSSDSHNLGGYDICTSCYHTLVRACRIKRDDGPNGWRKCPSGHRMIVIVFESDHAGHQRRVIVNDLVGGWKCTDDDIAAWSAAKAQAVKEGASNASSGPAQPTSPPQAGRWTWREDSSGSRKTRTRTSTLTSLTNSGETVSSTSPQKSPPFPPEGGLGLQAVALWSYYPEEGEDGKGELMFPKAAEVREIEEINDEWWHGVYMGDQGLFPAIFVRRF